MVQEIRAVRRQKKMISCRQYVKFAVTLLLFVGCSEVKLDTAPVVIMETEMGNIEIEVYPYRAPVTAANFLRYVDENRFREASFYRVVRTDNQPYSVTKIQVVQGGIGFVDSDLRLAPIIHETTDKTGILHWYGTISMARREPGTASSEFFICLKDLPELDYGGKRNPDGQGFSAFGRVIKGMKVVEDIQRLPAKEQMLMSPVKISRIRRDQPIIK